MQILRFQVDGSPAKGRKIRAFNELRFDGDAVELLGGVENIGDGGAGQKIGGIAAFFVRHKEASCIHILGSFPCVKAGVEQVYTSFFYTSI